MSTRPITDLTADEFERIVRQGSRRDNLVDLATADGRLREAMQRLLELQGFEDVVEDIAVTLNRVAEVERRLRDDEPGMGDDRVGRE